MLSSSSCSHHSRHALHFYRVEEKVELNSSFSAVSSLFSDYRHSADLSELHLSHILFHQHLYASSLRPSTPCPQHAFLSPSHLLCFPRSCKGRRVKYLFLQARYLVRMADLCVCVLVFECLLVKERRDEARWCPLCGVWIAWALKGLKVSELPSPPQTDRLRPSARRMRMNEEEWLDC